ncbi:hypothetical protein CSPHI_02070 [Corynebacterium sphenisci DSM 44792]|uniref:G domain-containing protein n=1 Tax=Corynebacterium sphenisci DSM 44792 TaxID=1437874 RepID=A0A1L7CW47_9CORY|nr:hypothetical protein [Corynebacterium sphenisci]APT90064.1 hypothetical protein CSPHI_02070 [Corynebacterium sphenisci DSM 44792]
MTETAPLEHLLTYLDREGRPGAAAALRGTLAEARGPRTVAVIGEAGRGASTLVDALVGAPLPAAEPGCVRRVLAVPPGAAPPELAAGVVAAETGLLPPLSLLDLPGFGAAGDPGGGARPRLPREAAAVLVVLDALAPITAAEAGLIAEAVRERGTVLVAVTKKDKNLLGWREILAEDRRLIEEAAGTAVPVHAVSALRALAAAGDPDPERAAAIAADSGIGALREALADYAGAGAHLAALRHARVLAAEELAIARELAAAGGRDAADRLAARERELTELQADGRRRRQLLAAELSGARIEALAELDRGLAAARERWDARFRDTPPRTLARRREEILAEIRAELGEVVEDALGTLLRRTRAAFLELTDGTGDWAAVLTAVDRIDCEVEAAERADPRLRDVLDPGLVTITVAGGFSLTHVATLLPGVGGAIAASGGVGAVPFAAVAGVWLAVNVYHRAARRGGKELRTWFREATATLRRQVGRDLDLVHNRIQPLVLNGFADGLERAVAEAAERVRAARAEQRAGAAAAERAADAAALRADWLAGELARIDGLLTGAGAR